MHDASLPGTHVCAYLGSSDHTDVAFFSGFGWMKQMPPADLAQYQQQIGGVYHS
jgi:hypothetical protein